MKAIIVGTSANLLDAKNGNKIDEFDYVVRSVSVTEFPGYEAHVGTKTDMYWSKYQYLFRFNFLNNYTKDILLLNNDPDNYYEDFCINHKYSKYNRFFYDMWREQKQQYLNFRKVYFYNKISLHNLHSVMGYKNVKDGRSIYASAGACVLDFFTSMTCFDEVWVTGFSFFDRATYFNPAINHNVREHSYYREKIFYTKLLKDKKIYELQP